MSVCECKFLKKKTKATNRTEQILKNSHRRKPFRNKRQLEIMYKEYTVYLENRPRMTDTKTYSNKIIRT